VALDSTKAPAKTMHPSVASLDDASSAGNRRPSQNLGLWPSPDRNRRQKPQETDPALGWIVGTEEGLEKRQRQGGDLNDRYETPSRDLPEGCPRNVVSPEGLPSTNGRCVDAEQPRKLADSARCRTLPHGADQDDHDAEVYLSAEKTHRRRCRPLSTAVTITGEAEPKVIILG
jgi:hypothetical protein